MSPADKINHDIDPEDLNLEVIIQRIFNETDPTAHRAAIWELFRMTGDWETYDKLSEFGGARGIVSYFQNIIDQIVLPTESIDSESDRPMIPADHQELIRDLYSGPIHCIQRGDWAGLAAAMFEILLTEIYEVYEIDENQLSFGEATSLNLEPYLSEEMLFPLNIIEYMTFSDLLSGEVDPTLLENHLALMLTLFFSAQAHLDIVESERSPGFQTGDDLWND